VQSRPYRSLLFVPAGRERFLGKAAEVDADAIVIDLEDAVPEDEKAAARRSVGDAIATLAATGKGVFVRVNGVTTPHWLEDLRAVTVPGLTGVSLAKVHTAAEVTTVAHVLDNLEPVAGVELGRIDIQPLLETAPGMLNAAGILGASPRIRSYFGGSARDGDISRELDSLWSRDGRETFYVRAKLLLDGRGQGVPYPISGTWTDLRDDEGLASFAAESRALGYTGMYVIHPDHVPVVNTAFTPTPEDLARYRAILDELQRAERDGHGSVALDGTMIDIAMAERARVMLALAAELGVAA
jgi:citrate lyase subunit beta/citryl-CoA lyase